MKRSIFSHIVLLLIPLLSSCIQEQVSTEIDGPSLPEGVPTTLIIPFGSTEALDVDVTTKAEASGVDEARIHDLYVMIFNKNDNSSGESLRGRSNPPAPEKSTWTKLKGNFFTHKGRLNREPYILRVTAVTLIYIADLATLLYIDTIPMRELTDFGVFLAVGLSIALIILAVSIFCLAIRRLHDLDRSGWWVLLSFVPIINFILGLYLMFKKGVVGGNRFGADPLA